MYIFGAITFIIFGTDVQQPWDRVISQQNSCAEDDQVAVEIKENSESSIGSKVTLDIDQVDGKVELQKKSA